MRAMFRSNFIRRFPETRVDSRNSDKSYPFFRRPFLLDLIDVDDKKLHFYFSGEPKSYLVKEYES